MTVEQDVIGQRLTSDAFAERLLVEQFHDEKAMAVVFADIVENANAGRIESGDGASFALEAFARKTSMGHP